MGGALLEYKSIDNKRHTWVSWDRYLCITALCVLALAVMASMSKSNNIRKRKQEVQELLVMECKRKKISAPTSESESLSGHGGSSSQQAMVTEPSNDSFAATTTAAADVKLEAEKSRLLYLFDQVEKGILIDGLKNSITAGNREVIQAISNVFDESVCPPRSSAMCARCEREFDPNYNTVTSCKLYHPGENIDRIHKFRNGSTWQCYTCNKTWNSDDCCDFFGVDTGFCFVGPHTAVEYELDKDFEHDDDLEEVKRKKYW